MKKIILIFICAIIAHLEHGEVFAGFGTRGGGNMVGDEIVDLYEPDPTSSSEIRKIASKILDEIQLKMPGLSLLIEDGLKSRKWYFVDVPLRNLGYEETLIEFQSEQVAIQNDSEVFINKPLFDKLNPLNREALIVHELVMTMRLNRELFRLSTDRRSRFDATSRDVRDLLKILIRAAQMSAQDLQKELLLHRFEHFHTAQQTNDIQDIREGWADDVKQIRNLCSRIGYDENHPGYGGSMGQIVVFKDSRDAQTYLNLMAKLQRKHDVFPADSDDGLFANLEIIQKFQFNVAAYLKHANSVIIDGAYARGLISEAEYSEWKTSAKTPQINFFSDQSKLPAHKRIGTSVCDSLHSKNYENRLVLGLQYFIGLGVDNNWIFPGSPQPLFIENN